MDQFITTTKTSRMPDQDVRKSRSGLVEEVLDADIEA